MYSHLSDLIKDQNLNINSIGFSSLQKEILKKLDLTIKSSFEDRDPTSLLELHQSLFLIYETKLAEPLSGIVQLENNLFLIYIKDLIEKSWLKYEIQEMQQTFVINPIIPSVQFVSEWFLHQAAIDSPESLDLMNFFQSQASLEDFKFFLLSDSCMALRFTTLLSLSQTYISEDIKQELIQNLWDETGSGDVKRSHYPLFQKLLDFLEIEIQQQPVWDTWEPYAGYNLYFCFALNRQHHYKSLGALGISELVDSRRNQFIVDGLKRLGLPENQYKFYQNHLDLEEKHGISWLENVILPEVIRESQSLTEFCIGAKLQLKMIQGYHKYLLNKFKI